MRAMVTGRPNDRAQYRATPSPAILETEYGADGGAIASPSGSSSRNGCQGSGCGLYTVTVDITSAAFARAAVLEDEAGALGVHPQRPLVVVRAEVGREVQQVA